MESRAPTTPMSIENRDYACPSGYAHYTSIRFAMALENQLLI